MTCGPSKVEDELYEDKCFEKDKDRPLGTAREETRERATLRNDIQELPIEMEPL